jgi:pimeloyl-ACP methyl ester carboxylesterase
MVSAAPVPFELAPAPGHTLAGDLLPGRAPCLVYLHGLGSSRAGDKSSALFARCAQRGQAAARFDFRGHGESSGELGDLLLSDVIADAMAVAQWAGPCVLIGSSLGGLAAAHAAAALHGHVRGVVLIAPAFGFVERLVARNPAGSRLTVVLSDGRSLLLHERFLDDARLQDEATAAVRLRQPVLIVHGEFDEVVPVGESHRFFGRLGQTEKALWVVPGGDHRLNLQADQIWDRMDVFLQQHQVGTRAAR